jgi:hypothetical protein
VDIDSFSDAAPEVREDAVLDIAVETPAATEAPVAAEALLLLKPLQLLMSLCPFTPATKLPPSSLRSSNSLFTGVKILSRVLPCSKFVKLFSKARLPLLP